MHPTTSLASLIQDTNLTTAEVQNVSNSEDNPVLGDAAEASLRVCQLAKETHGLQGVIEVIHDILRVILVQHNSASDEVRLFTATLNTLCAGMKSQQSTHRFKGFFKHRDRNNQPDVCRTELLRILEILRSNDGAASALPDINSAFNPTYEKTHTLRTRAPDYSSSMSPLQLWVEESALLSTLPRLGFLKYVDEDGRRRVQTPDSDVENWEILRRR
ncbi:hypothetical protein C8R44DRAFT_755662 [Mycena epipterygia]|nr:hypothetical protein C8R44DRAFT_755662 [Mycena epipterygia]